MAVQTKANQCGSFWCAPYQRAAVLTLFLCCALALFAVALLSRTLLANGAPVAASTAAPQQAPASWLQFRGPNGSGLAAASAIPFPNELDPQVNLRWKVEVPPGHSSPIVIGNSIVLTGYEPEKLLVLCYDRQTGQLRWRRELPVAAFEKTHEQHGPASATPASDGERIFATFGSFGQIAFDLDGKELWRHERAALRNTFGSASSPVLIDGKLIVFWGDEGTSLVQALNPANGDVLWERKKPGPASSWSSPVAWRSGDEPALLVYEPFNLRCLKLADGTELWTVPGLADEPITLPQLGSGLIFTTSYNLGVNMEAHGLPTWEQALAECDANGDGMISAAESQANKSVLSRPDADGEGDHPLRWFVRMLDEDKDGQIEQAEWPRLKAWTDSWKHANGFLAIRDAGGSDAESRSVPELAWKTETGVPECPSPILIGERLFAVRNGGVVTCLDTTNGRVLSQTRAAAGGPYYASPVAADGKLYLASERGLLSVLEAADNPRRQASCELGEAIWGTPALVDGEVIVRSERHLWLFADPR